jgi:hypothetical protein
MSRACVGLLLLGLASPAGAQMPTPAPWTLVSGDYTIYGHTDYNPILTLVPRVVFDTAAGLDSTRVVDSVRAGSPAPVGLAAGLSNWPASMYCGNAASGTVQPLDPRDLLARVQLGARCGVRLVLVVPRRLLTTNRLTEGPFSVDSARRATDQYAAVLPPDTLRKYRWILVGLNLADDYTCLRCWGGKAITQAQLAEWAEYARAKLPGLPLGVRRTPDWVAQSPALAARIDYVWAQYHTARGEIRKYFDAAADLAARLGLRVVMGLNAHDCHGLNTTPCTPAELVTFGTTAVSHPATCAFLSWRYDEPTWQRADIRMAWDSLLALARARRAQECRRVTGSESTTTF